MNRATAGCLPCTNIDRDEQTALLSTVKAMGNGLFCVAPPERRLMFTRRVDEPLSPQELSDLLRGHKQLTPKEQQEFTITVLRAAFAKDRLSLEDTLTPRIRTAWRLTREIARTKNLLKLDEPLIASISTATPLSLDMWTMPTDTPEDHTTQKWFHNPDAATSATLRRTLHATLNTRPEKQCWCLSHPTDENPFTLRPGLPLLPPPVPLDQFDQETGEILDTYDPNDPDHDPLLHDYISALGDAADYLGAWHGTHQDPEQGRKGMMGLTNPMTVRIAFPTRMQLISWEYLLITKTLEALTGSERKGHTADATGNRHAYNMLHQKYGLQHIEVDGMIKMTKRFAREMVNADRSEDRALMILRCEDVMSRSRQALDLKSEMSAMKQMGMILGLTRTEEDETLQDLEEVVKKNTQARKLASAKPIATLTFDDPQE